MLAQAGIMRERSELYEIFGSADCIRGSSECYKEWRGYRQKLTDFIEENCVAEGGGKPVLAIWGAGRSNDIDLARLAERFKLVLIDRDAEGLVQACKTYGLEGTDVICVDLPFWNVELETYEMFEALLAEGEEAEIVIEHLKQVAFDNSHRVLPDIGRRFDYSVCVGLQPVECEICRPVIYVSGEL